MNIQHKRYKRTYRIALLIWLITTLFLFWANGAIGIIGSENNPANLLYIAVFFVVIVGSIISRLKPYWMTRTFFITAIIQFLVPVFALLVWPAKTSWGSAGVLGVFIFNFIFVLFFLTSGLLFYRAKNN